MAEVKVYTGYFLHLVYIAQVIALRYVSLFQSKSNAYVQQDWLKECIFSGIRRLNTAAKAI